MYNIYGRPISNKELTAILRGVKEIEDIQVLLALEEFQDIYLTGSCQDGDSWPGDVDFFTPNHHNLKRLETLGFVVVTHGYYPGVKVLKCGGIHIIVGDQFLLDKLRKFHSIISFLKSKGLNLTKEDKRKILKSL